MNDYARLEQYCVDQGIPCLKTEPLREHCTFRIGGGADRFIQPSSEEQIEAIQTIAGEDSLPLHILGKGSNVLFSDSGYQGVVLHLGSAFGGMRLLDDTTIDCDSGATLAQLCIFAQENGLTGLEFAYGIPGSVGGAIYMNAGAYDGEMKDVLVSTRHIGGGGKGVLTGSEMDLAYRHSAYSGGDRIVTGGVFRLQKGDPAAIRVQMEDIMERRRSKQPLEYPSAGSTFKRPSGAYASALIDQCGLRGKRVGGAMISEKHAGFVVNCDNATCADVLALIALVQADVEGKTGYKLDCEVKIYG